jgi:hypothetical protein
MGDHSADKRVLHHHETDVCVLSERDRPEACDINFLTPGGDEGGLLHGLQFVTLCRSIRLAKKIKQREEDWREHHCPELNQITGLHARRLP